MAQHTKFVIHLILLNTAGLLLASYSHADLPLTIESLTTDKDRFKLDTTVSYFNQNSSNLLSQGSTNIDLGDGRSITIPNIPTEGKVNTDNLIGTLGLRYGITEDWEVGIKANALTLEQRLEHNGKVTTQSDDRFQDISLTTQYQLTQNHDSLPDSLVFTELSVYDNTQELKSCYLTSALVGSTIYTVNDPIALSLTGTYQYNGNRDFKESIGKVDIGDVFSLNGSVGFAVNPDITLNTGVGWRMVKGDKFDNSDISSAKYTQTSLNVGLAYALNERSNLTANLRTYAFDDSQDLQVMAMTNQEMEETEGAVAPLAILGGAAVGMWAEHGISLHKTGQFASTKDVLVGGAIGATPAGAIKVGKFAKYGQEISFGRNFRVAPFGNRTGHPQGKYPHYHRRGIDKSGNTLPGQGIGRHRPWERKSTDRSWRDKW